MIAKKKIGIGKVIGNLLEHSITKFAGDALIDGEFDANVVCSIPWRVRTYVAGRYGVVRPLGLDFYDGTA